MKKINIKIMIFAIFLSILLLCTLNVIKFGKNENTIKINMEHKTGDTYQILSINIGGTDQNLKNYIDDNMSYDEDYNFLYSKNPVQDFVINVNALQNIKITFIKNKNNGLVNIIEDNKYKKIENKVDTKSDNIEYVDFIDGITIKEILLYEIYNLDYKDCFIIFTLFIIFTVIFYYITRYLMYILEKSKERNLKVIEIINIILVIFIISFSHIYLLVEILNYLYGILIIGILLLFILKNKEIFKKTENIFLLFGIITGIMFVFLMPPFNVPDEGAHYLKAYSMTMSKKENKQFLTEKNTANTTIYIPETMAITMHNYIQDLHSINYKTSIKTMLGDFNRNIDDDKGERYQHWIGNTYHLSKFCYILSALSIKITRILNLSVIFSVLLARLFNLIFFITLIYKSISKMTKFKNTILISSLLPITLQQAAAINQDSITNTLCLTLIAIILTKIFDKQKEYNFKEYIIIAILAVGLSFCKLVYFPILFLLFLIPFRKFKNNKTKYLIISIILTTNLIITFINIKQMNLFSLTNTSEYYSIKTIINEPIRTFKIILNTCINRFNLDILGGLINGFGYSTKWMNNLFSFVISTIFILLYFSANNDEAQKKDISIKKRFIFIIIFITIFGFIYGSLLVGYSSINTDIIQGLQSRYFIPLIPILLCIITNNNIKLNFRNNDLINNILLLIVFFATIVTIIHGFYV